MTCVEKSPPKSEKLYACYAVDAVREAIASGRFYGVSGDDPMVASLLAILERVEWAASSKAIAQALPHAPETFSLHDLRSTLSRLGISSRVVRYRRRSKEELTTPALVMKRRRLIGLWVESDNGERRLIDPLTGHRVTDRVPRSASIVTFNKPVAQCNRWFVFDLFYRAKGALFGLLGIKLVTNLVTVLAALSVFAIFSNVTASESTDTLLAIGIGMAGAFAVDFAYRLGKARLLARLSARLEYLISSLAFRQVLSLPLEKLIAGTVAQQIARLRPLNTMASSLVVPLVDALTDLPFSVLLTILLFFLAGPIGALPIIVFATFALAFVLLMPGIRRLEDDARISSEAHGQIMSDIINHADDIRLSFDRETWAERAKHAVKRRASANRKAEVAARNLSMIGTIATPLVGGSTAVAGTALAMNGNLSTGGLIAAMILSWRIIAPMQTLLLLVSKWSDMLRLSGQLNRLMNMATEEDEVDVGTTLQLNGDVAFSGIVHRYGAASDWTLRGVTAKIPKGSFVALTGPSGSGKSTFLRMIASLLHPTSGTISIDGFNIRQIPISRLRDSVSYVPFDPILIHGTIRQNLSLGAPLIGDTEILSSLREVGLGDYVHTLPDGIHTRLTDDVQSEFPNGFRQALAIAQALVRRPKILLLDEPAHSLDPALDRAMMAALKKRRGDMTIIMVTHRPSHISETDFQIDLRNGQVHSVQSSRKEAS